LLIPGGEEFHGSIDMDLTFKTALRQQFGAAIDMLENAVRACPDEPWQVRLWGERIHQAGLGEFW
jgi:hypothetical protein